VAWLRVTNWSHQKIDRPRVAKIKMSDITWVSEIDSSNDREASSNVRRKDRIGKDRIGSDRISSAGVQAPAAVAAEVVHLNSSKSGDREANRAAWDAYAEAYFARYQVEAVRNAKVNSNIAQFVARVGAHDAPDILRFYVQHNDSFYLRQSHPLSFALKDAEGLRTQWLRGRAVTGVDVRRFEQRQQQVDLLDAIDRGEV
jgi:hypothetical protein